jgi:hypothetical protein
MMLNVTETCNENIFFLCICLSFFFSFNFYAVQCESGVFLSPAFVWVKLVHLEWQKRVWKKNKLFVQSELFKNKKQKQLLRLEIMMYIVSTFL